MIKKKLIIVMPTFNEEKTIKKVVNDWVKIAKKYSGLLLIINDGSTDDTLKILKDIKNKNIKVINQKNIGHCRSLVKGYKFAIKKSYRHIFQVDSDDQFTTKDFSYFWKNKNYDFLLGYRKKRFDQLIRLIITRILILFIFLRFGVFINDANTPYRLINGKLLKKYFYKIKHTKYVPNILLSIFFFKNFKSKTIIIKHKKRKFGVPWIIRLNLLKFCLRSALKVFKFKTSF